MHVGDRGRCQPEGERRLEGPGVVVVRQLGARGGAAISGHAGNGAIEHRVGRLDELVHQPVERRDRGDAVRGEPVEPGLDGQVVQRRAVERHEHDAPRSELVHRARGVEDQLADGRERHGARAGSGHGVDAHFEVLAEEQRVAGPQARVEVPRKPLRDEAVVVQREVRPVVLDRVDEEPRRDASVEQALRFAVGQVVQVKRVAHGAGA